MDGVEGISGSNGRIPAIESAKLINSLRASEFDIPSAIGELVDNSIQAEAKNIHLYIDKLDANGKKKRTSEYICGIICGDDGTGMEGGKESPLHQCVKLGYSTRYNDRKGIGRFGVGMTLAGIKYATKIEVYSKVIGGKWNYISFDINDKEDLESGIRPPFPKEIPAEYAKYAGKEHGTLVIWSNFDNFNEADVRVSTYEDNLKKYSLDPYGKLNYWLGRTFRHFIAEKEVNIFLNENEVFALDPLYYSKVRNHFPSDPAAEIKWDKDVEWFIPGTQNKSKIHIKVTKLPLAFRSVRGEGAKPGRGDEDRPFEGRFIDENLGISIVRAGREVYYDDIPHFKTSGPHSVYLKKVDHDRFWGCEISFEPELDECFTVKNIKRGIVPKNIELKSALCDKIFPVVKKIREDIILDWDEQERKDEKSGKPDPHKEAEEIINEKPLPGKKEAGSSVTDDKKEELKQALLGMVDQQERSVLENKFDNQDYLIQDSAWRGEAFIDIAYAQGKAVIMYNKSHLFMKEFAQIREQLNKKEGDPEELAARLNLLMDLLFFSLLRARQEYGDSEEKFNVHELLSKLTSDWGAYMTSLLKDRMKNKGC